MRLKRRNQKKMFYAYQDGTQPVYETDDEGNIRYMKVDGELIPIPTGETEIKYSEPQEFQSSISMSGGEAEAQAYGLSIQDYDATLICPIEAFLIAEGSLIWVKSKIAYKDENNTILDTTSADWKVVKCVESRHFVRYALKAVVK